MTGVRDAIDILKKITHLFKSREDRIKFPKMMSEHQDSIFRHSVHIFHEIIVKSFAFSCFYGDEFRFRGEKKDL